MSCQDFDYNCSDEDCVDAWDLSRLYGCYESPNIVMDMCEVEVGDCVEFNPGNERMWGEVVEICSCSIIVEVVSTLKFDHGFTTGDRVKLELKHIYNVEEDCSKI